MNSITPTGDSRQHDPSLCPSWCDREHLSQAIDTMAGGFHHDAAQWALLPATQPVRSEDRYLYINTSQFVDDSGAARPPMVELRNTDDLAAVLTASEALQLAAALIAAADRLVRGAEDPQ